MLGRGGDNEPLFSAKRRQARVPQARLSRLRHAPISILFPLNPATGPKPNTSR